jgi:acetylornithine deacetylase/succinyl-diaminopimelate desuccinylase
MDTVPVYDMENPYEVSNVSGKLYGRGTVDMKGPLACMMMAMVALKRLKVPLQEDVWFAGVIDEEEKSLGTIALIEEGFKVDAAIVGEPTDLEICMAHRGLEWLEFEIVGKTVHGGRQREGINAIQKAAQFITMLEDRMAGRLAQRIHPVAGSSTMNLGTISGGTQPSTVAGSCVLTVDRRWIPGESYEDVLKEYQDVITELSKKDPEFKCHMRVMENSVMKPGYVHEAMEIDPDSEIVQSLTEAVQMVSGARPNKTYFPAWSDAGLLSTYANIPTIVFAPGQLESAHSKDEFISVNQLMPAVKAYALTAALYCKVKGDDA